MKKSYLLLMCLGLAGCSNAVASKNSTLDNEAGTFQLFKIKEGENEVLYKINTKTGTVWNYSERLIVSSSNVGFSEKQKKWIDKLLEAAKQKGTNLYTPPYWVLTSEELSEDGIGCTLHF